MDSRMDGLRDALDTAQRQLADREELEQECENSRKIVEEQNEMIKRLEEEQARVSVLVSLNVGG